MSQSWQRTSLCQAGPGEASGNKGQGGRGLTLQGWRPGIEAVRWGSIDQQEGSEDKLVDTRPTSERCTQCRKNTIDTVWMQVFACWTLHTRTVLKYPSLFMDMNRD